MSYLTLAEAIDIVRYEPPDRPVSPADERDVDADEDAADDDAERWLAEHMIEENANESR